MNEILNNKSANKLQGVLAPKTNESVETAGSLAMSVFKSLFATESFDEFSSSNPFIVDYSLYSDSENEVACNGFLESFSNALSAINEGGCSSVSDCGCSSEGCSSSGFTSMC